MQKSRTFTDLLHQIPKLPRPHSVFEDFPCPGKMVTFSRTFLDFQGSGATLRIRRRQRVSECITAAYRGAVVELVQQVMRWLPWWRSAAAAAAVWLVNCEQRSLPVDRALSPLHLFTCAKALPNTLIHLYYYYTRPTASLPGQPVKLVIER